MGDGAPGRGYSARDVARLLDLGLGQIRRYVREGFLEPERGERGELRFDFRDLVLLRIVKRLADARIPPRRIRSALERLRSSLPGDRPLSGVRVAAAGRHVVAREGERQWDPETGQYCFLFSEESGTRDVLPFPRPGQPELEIVLDASGWYALGVEVEDSHPEEAQRAYERAVQIDPRHADAHVNLGCLLHEAGDVKGAEWQYRAALEARPGDATAAFDLGVALEDQGRDDEACAAYRLALRADPDLAEAHYNLARFYDRRGEVSAAIRHLRAYRRLTRGY